MEKLDQLNAKVFSQQLHTKFKVHVDSRGPLELELAEVNERQTAPRIELFSLIFRGPAVPRLMQQTHRLEHGELGTFDIFLTPVGLDDKGTLYEAVFHRFGKPQL